MNKTTKNRPVVQTKRRKTKSLDENKIDTVLLLIVIALVLFGIMMVYSSSYYTAAKELNDSTYYLRRQAMYAVVGAIVMYSASKFDYRLYYSKIPWLLYAVSFVLVIYAGFFGISSNGASRWINILGFSVQPSEIAKVAIILLVPYQIATKPHLLKTLKGHAILMIPTIVMAGFVAKENLSTAIIIGVIGVGILFLASPRTWEFFAIAFLGIAGMVSYLAIDLFIGDGFRGLRFAAWLDPFAHAQDKGYQIIQSLYAVASGGFFGLGLGKSRQKLSFIPEAHNDIIFAIICEELGFFGAVIILAIFAVFIWKIFDISSKCNNIFPALICSGFGIMVAAQVIINVAVVTNTIPNTGIPMPFISSGGSALVVAMGLTGIILNISRSVDLK